MKLRKICKRIPPLILSILMILTVTVQTTLAYVVSKTNPVVNTFVPFDSITGDLIINKAIEHPFGNSYVIPETVAFDFEVNLGSFYANTKLQTTLGEITTDKNGTLAVTVKPGTPVGIEGIDEGTKVTIKEIQKENDGFTPENGQDTKEISVVKDGSIVSFINVYNPAAVKSGNVTVTGTKILEGREWKAGDSFTFLLDREVDGKWVTVGTQTVTYDANNNAFNQFNFNDVIQSQTYEKAGIYNFRLTEVKGESDFIKYDSNENYFTVIVGDADMDGKLEIQNVTASQNAAATKDEATGAYNVAVTFTNVHDGTQAPPTEDYSAAVFAVVLIATVMTAAVIVANAKKQKTEE